MAAAAHGHNWQKCQNVNSKTFRKNHLAACPPELPESACQMLLPPLFARGNKTQIEKQLLAGQRVGRRTDNETGVSLSLAVSWPLAGLMDRQTLPACCLVRCRLVCLSLATFAYFSFMQMPIEVFP